MIKLVVATERWGSPSSSDPNVGAQHKDGENHDDDEGNGHPGGDRTCKKSESESEHFSRDHFEDFGLTPLGQAVDANFVVHRDGQHRCLRVAGDGRSLLIGDGQELKTRHEHGVCMGNVEHAL